MFVFTYTHYKEVIPTNSIDFFFLILYNIKKIDTIIVDPPRVGLSNRVKNYILKINPKNIIYVSCDSVTLARDLKTLTESYNIKEIKLFDLFPNTYHVECVAILHRKTL